MYIYWHSLKSIQIPKLLHYMEKLWKFYTIYGIFKFKLINCSKNFHKIIKKNEISNSLTYIILSVVHRLYTNKKVTCTCMMYAPNFLTKKRLKNLYHVNVTYSFFLEQGILSEMFYFKLLKNVTCYIYRHWILNLRHWIRFLFKKMSFRWNLLK